MKLPKTEKMKSTKTKSPNTFIIGPIANYIVAISAYRPSFLPATLRMRVTLRTLKILAS